MKSHVALLGTWITESSLANGTLVGLFSCLKNEDLKVALYIFALKGNINLKVCEEDQERSVNLFSVKKFEVP